MQYIKIEPNSKKTKRDVIDFFKVMVAIQLLMLGLSYITQRITVFVGALAILGIFVVYGFVVLRLKTFHKNPSECDNNKTIAILSIGYSVLCSLGFAHSFSETIIVFIITLVIMGFVLLFEYFIIKKIYKKSVAKKSTVSKKDDALNKVMLILLTTLGATFGVLYPQKDINLILVLSYFLFSVVFAFGYSNIMKAKELEQSENHSNQLVDDSLIDPENN